MRGQQQRQHAIDVATTTILPVLNPTICCGGSDKRCFNNREDPRFFQFDKHLLNGINTRPTYFNNFSDPLKLENLAYCVVGALRPGKKGLA